MNPLRNILRLASGDFVAKVLSFLAVVYLARVLGVESYGVFEFAISVLFYFLLIADGGIELWATRSAAQGKAPVALAAAVVPARIAWAVVSFAALGALLPALPDMPSLRPVLLLFGLTLFVQAGDLKWAFLGQERMAGVAVGLVAAQFAFALGVVTLVHEPAHIIWVPICRLAGDTAAAAYFGIRFVRAYGKFRLQRPVRATARMLRPALTMGLSKGLAIASYNLDSILLGFLAGATSVGWYSAAYKPVTVVLAVPVTFFIGLFPVLSRTYAEGTAPFTGLVVRSLRFAAVVAAPIGIGGTLLASPIIFFLFGAAYTNAIPALQILAWSATLVILRGTFRQALNAAGRQDVDLRVAGLATAVNLLLNLVLIPRYGILGAAVATVSSEIVWLSTIWRLFSRIVTPVSLVAPLIRPLVATGAMTAVLLMTATVPWPVRAGLGTVTYLMSIWLLGKKTSSMLWPTNPTSAAGSSEPTTHDTAPSPPESESR